MVDLENIKGIYLYPELVSYRMGIPALSNLILCSYEERTIRDCLFVFFGRDKKQIKMIEINDDGIWLYNKRLNESVFRFPKKVEEVRMNKNELSVILEAIKDRKK